MEFAPKQFFTEREDADIQGFVVLESSETGPGYGEPSYRMAEKWGNRWTTYWIPEETLLARVERGECAATTTVSDTQFEGVKNLAGVADQYEEASTPTL